MTVTEQRDARWDTETGMAALGPGWPSEFGCHVLSRLVLEDGRGVLEAVMETEASSSLWVGRERGKTGGRETSQGTVSGIWARPWAHVALRMKRKR